MLNSAVFESKDQKLYSLEEVDMQTLVGTQDKQYNLAVLKDIALCPTVKNLSALVNEHEQRILQLETTLADERKVAYLNRVFGDVCACTKDIVKETYKSKFGVSLKRLRLRTKEVGYLVWSFNLKANCFFLQLEDVLSILNLTFENWLVILDFYHIRNAFSHGLAENTYSEVLQLCEALSEHLKPTFLLCSDLVLKHRPEELKQQD